MLVSLNIMRSLILHESCKFIFTWWGRDICTSSIQYHVWQGSHRWTGWLSLATVKQSPLLPPPALSYLSCTREDILLQSLPFSLINDHLILLHSRIHYHIDWPTPMHSKCTWHENSAARIWTHVFKVPPLDRPFITVTLITVSRKSINYLPLLIIYSTLFLPDGLLSSLNQHDWHGNLVFTLPQLIPSCDIGIICKLHAP